MWPPCWKYAWSSFLGYLEELKKLPKHASVVRTPAPNPRAEVKWIPPAHGLFKINVDASVSRSEERGAAAALCRDSNGIYQGLLHCFQGVADPTTLEELAFYGVLVLAEDLGINRIFVASDCKVVIDDIASGTNGRYGAIIIVVFVSNIVYELGYA
jgi:hypothetical protein